MTQLKHKTFLFDFDGTLVDSMPTFVGLMLRILDENGIDYGDDIVKTITPLGLAGTARHFIGMGLDMAESDILFFDDNLGACTTAKEAGMMVCGVYDKSSEEYTAELKAATDYYIKDFSDIKNAGIA